MSKHIAEVWQSLWNQHLRFVVLVLFVALGSLGLFMLADWLVVQQYPRLSRAAERMAELSLTVVVLQLLVRFWLVGQAEAAFFERLKVRDSLVKSGFQDFFWFDKVPWEELFQNAADVEIFAITARSLTGERIGVVRGFMRRPNTKLTIIVHDPEDADAMAQFDKRFGERPGTRREKIIQNVRELQEMASAEGLKEERFKICFTRGSPSYTYYRFDDSVLYVPYLIKPNTRVPDHIPAFLFAKGEVFDKFLAIDSKYVLDSAQTAPSFKAKV